VQDGFLRRRQGNSLRSVSETEESKLTVSNDKLPHKVLICSRSMISAKCRRLVTLKGECFEVNYQGVIPGSRDGVFHDFRLTDLPRNRGVRRIAVTRAGARDMYTPTVAEFDRREDTVVLNTIRRAFDRNILSFDTPTNASTHQEISLEPSDFAKQSLQTDDAVRSYIIHKAYFLSYRYPIHLAAAGVLAPISFGDEDDLEYLGFNLADIFRIVGRMVKQGLLENTIDVSACPTEKLLALHEADDVDDLKFARLAIEQARKSISELDGKTHPKVGAIVVKNGQILSEGHRGEVPQNHAEFVALEIKLRDDAVLGSTVYTTLEPCTTRTHPKVPCADRLAERKVARVVVGMLDPDPRITGQGVRKLRNANITIAFFPPDLMTEVEELNRDFIRFCDQQNQLKNAENAKLEQQVDSLKREVVELSRRPYQEALGKHGELLISRLSTIGKRLMRHLLQNEPLEVGRKFMLDISEDDQFKQLTIAMDMGIIRHHEVRVGSGNLLRTEYHVNPQYRPVLEDLLYR
jgi:pyrimidine deaminase RibD-like protein